MSTSVPKHILGPIAEMREMIGDAYGNDIPENVQRIFPLGRYYVEIVTNDPKDLLQELDAMCPDEYEVTDGADNLLNRHMCLQEKPKRTVWVTAILDCPETTATMIKLRFS